MSEQAAAGAVATAAGRRTTVAAVAFLGPATAFVVIGLALPLILLFRYSLNAFVPGQFMVEALTLENYVRFFTDEFYGRVILRTFIVALASTLCCLVLGFPIAVVLARTTSRFKSIFVMLVVLPLFIGPSIRAAGWMVAFGRDGLVNSGLMGLGMMSTPAELMYTPTAVIVGLVAVNLSFMVLTLQSVIENIDPAVEEAALSLGATPLERFRYVTFPLAMPGIVAGCILCFILATNAYATPVLLGGPRFQTMAPLIYTQIAQQSNWPFGAALSFILMTSTLALTVASNVFIARRYGRQ